MSYCSVDEIEQFSFEDCRILKMQQTAEGFQFQVEALIVRPQNSQNTQFTESYADIATLKVLGVEEVSAVKEGYRYYDADDRLIEEVPDTLLTSEQMGQMLKESAGAYLFEVRKDSQGLHMRIEFSDSSDQDPLASTTYEIVMKQKEVVVTWGKYLNRVQR
ncbi:hypothetical protein [Eubacterium oxidoreducens]|uniref:Subtilin biosynthesis sensor protein SpaK n=1 Tax=Eubacterium oxidoreducens TaxID=1732 RepID=A0A1G6BCJ5_EUBOX|nr:hypothetical protein [Eubacterium oxidoreducens]SDB18351.1 hypothetical protein SAMN02910417_01366 [Eubacterium oxidoreducens]